MLQENSQLFLYSPSPLNWNCEYSLTIVSSAPFSFRFHLHLICNSHINILSNKSCYVGVVLFPWPIISPATDLLNI